MNKLYLRSLILFLFLALFSNYTHAVIRLKINFSSFQCYRDQNNNAGYGELIIFRSNIPDAGNNYGTVAARLTISSNLTDYYFNIGSTAGYYTCVFNKPTASQASYVTTSPITFYNSVYLSDGQTQDFSLSCTPPDLTAPEPQSAETDTEGNQVTLNFNESIESYSYLSPDEWIIKVNGVTRAITGAFPNGNSVIFTVSPAITNAQNVSVSLLYSDIIYDDGFNTSEPFNDFVVVNNVNSLLPIKLKNFEGKSSPHGNSISWITESEQNTGSIILEKSKNGATFYTINSFKPKGPGKYAYTDEQSNGRSFYRLKIIDLDGSIQMSDIIVVGSQELNQTNIKISPNPARNSITIHSVLQEATLRIMDTRGQEVKRVIWKSGNKVDVSFLKPGIYFIELSNGSEMYRDRLLIVY